MPLVTTPAGELFLVDTLPAPLASGAELLQLLMDAGTETVALHADHLAPAFFELSTGLAGDMLQKISNYQLRLVILGEFHAVSSRSLRDFITESNRRGRVVFAATLEEATPLLR